MLKYPKFQYTRSKELRMAVAALPCQLCGSTNMVQAAHSNQLVHGKGRGVKASDEYIAALCQRHHYEIDQGSHLSKDERIQEWTRAHENTVNLLLEMGKWPEDVPLPKWKTELK